MDERIVDLLEKRSIKVNNLPRILECHIIKSAMQSSRSVIHLIILIIVEKPGENDCPHDAPEKTQVKHEVANHKH